MENYRKKSKKNLNRRYKNDAKDRSRRMKDIQKTENNYSLLAEGTKLVSTRINGNNVDEK